ncbi:MAG: RNA polymerase sigma-70 factor [Marinifilaceae bacterium]|nr:RNA polymerase sigma-70 factor [Marinifilaceae bacterium]
MNNNKIIFENIVAGDILEFEKMFKMYFQPLCIYAFKFLKNDILAEELVQDLMCKIWENKHKIKINTSINAYLYRSTYINSISLLSKIKRNSEVQAKYISSANSDIEIEDKELNILISKILNQLPERNRKIFEMSRFEGLKYKQIADKLSISVKTVEANISKALKVFKKGLRDYMYQILF